MRLVVKSTPPQLGKAPTLLRSGKYKTLVLDISSVDFVSSLFLTRWKCLIGLAQESQINISVVPPKKAAALNDAGRTGLFEKTDYSYPFDKNLPEKFFPLIRIENDCNEALHEHCERVLSYSNASINYVRPLADAFTELADNVYYHSGQSENTGWGYVHAQVYEQGSWFWKKGYVRIAVSDVGIGFYGSYKRANQIRNRTEGQILLDAFEEGESCLNPFPKPGVRGIGLNMVYQFIKRYSGVMRISSGNIMVTATQEGLKDSMLPDRTDGAWIELEVPIL